MHVEKGLNFVDIRILRKYLFALTVITYLVTSAGVPIYLHYCGGELEQVNYVIKSDGCCGDEESTDAENDSCCRNESLLLVNSSDFVLKVADDALTSALSSGVAILLPWSVSFPDRTDLCYCCLISIFDQPPCEQQLTINSTVFRI